VELWGIHPLSVVNKSVVNKIDREIWNKIFEIDWKFLMWTAQHPLFYQILDPPLSFEGKFTFNIFNNLDKFIGRCFGKKYQICTYRTLQFEYYNNLNLSRLILWECHAKTETWSYLMHSLVHISSISFVIIWQQRTGTNMIDGEQDLKLCTQTLLAHDSTPFRQWSW
jgi:hypothetical protein